MSLRKITVTKTPTAISSLTVGKLYTVQVTPLPGATESVLLADATAAPSAGSSTAVYVSPGHSTTIKRDASTEEVYAWTLGADAPIVLTESP